MKKPTGTSISKERAMEIAGDWHSGQGSYLYSFASTGRYQNLWYQYYLKECNEALNTAQFLWQKKDLYRLIKYFVHRRYELEGHVIPETEIVSQLVHQTRNLNGLGELSNDEKLNKMLAVDKKTYEMLVSMDVFLRDPKSQTNPNYAAIKKSFEGLRERYNARQDDYKNNSIHKLGQSITEYADKAIEWFKSISSMSPLFGLGAAPLVVPVAIATGAVLTVSVVTYFVYKYYSETSVDYNEALKTVELLARHNPELAEEMLKKISAVKKNEQETGLFNQVGTGLKWGIAVVSLGVVGAGTYYVGRANKWF
jgi:hypothetical protein